MITDHNRGSCDHALCLYLLYRMHKSISEFIFLMAEIMHITYHLRAFTNRCISYSISKKHSKRLDTESKKDFFAQTDESELQNSQYGYVMIGAKAVCRTMCILGYTARDDESLRGSFLTRGKVCDDTCSRTHSVLVCPQSKRRRGTKR